MYESNEVLTIGGGGAKMLGRNLINIINSDAIREYGDDRSA